MKINSLKLYWAGPKEIAGPRPSPACAAQARGKEDGPQRVNPPAWLGLASRGRAPCRSARWRDGGARPAVGGRLRPRQRQRASAGDVRGEGELGRVARRGWRGEGRRIPWRPSTAAPWPSAARRGEARPVLGRRSKLERDFKEGEAELRARGIGEWRGGAGV